MAHYTANGWVQGKGKPIKCWKSCVITWEKTKKKESKPRANTVKQKQMQDLSSMLDASEVHDDKLRNCLENTDTFIGALPGGGTHTGDTESD
jgi:hypothetical protein